MDSFNIELENGEIYISQYIRVKTGKRAKLLFLSLADDEAIVSNTLTFEQAKELRDWLSKTIEAQQ